MFGLTERSKGSRAKALLLYIDSSRLISGEPRMALKFWMDVLTGPPPPSGCRKCFDFDPESSWLESHTPVLIEEFSGRGICKSFLVDEYNSAGVGEPSSVENLMKLCGTISFLLENVNLIGVFWSPIIVFGVLFLTVVGKASSISIGSWPAIALLFYDALFVLFIIKSQKAIINKIYYKSRNNFNEHQYYGKFKIIILLIL